MTEFPGEVDFVGPGVEVRLTPEGPRSHLEIRVQHDQADAVHLEVLLVPRDERGLATGAPTAIYASTWPLRRLEGRETAVAEGWLPRSLEPDLARRCYYRVTPVMMNASNT